MRDGLRRGNGRDGSLGRRVDAPEREPEDVPHVCHGVRRGFGGRSGSARAGEAALDAQAPLARPHESGQARRGRGMAQIPQWSTVVVATPLNLARQERGRRKALEVLLPALEERGVTQLNLESRWVQEDQFDIDMVRALRSRRVIRDIRVDHVSSDEQA